MPIAKRVPKLGILLAASGLTFAVGAQDLPPPPAGNYTADPTHAIVTFSVNHLGLSEFVATFDIIDADLTIDPSDPSTASVTARIPVSSLDIPGGSAEFFETMMGPAFFNSETHQDITFTSKAIKLTGEKEADVSGNLTLLGETRSVTLNTRYNTGYGADVLEPVARIGFSASTKFRRSEFGMSFGIPPEGTTFGVGDQVSVQLEMEFITTLSD